MIFFKILRAGGFYSQASRRRLPDTKPWIFSNMEPKNIQVDAQL